jgi:hypothetical protein
MSTLDACWWIEVKDDLYPQHLKKCGIFYVRYRYPVFKYLIARPACKQSLERTVPLSYMFRVNRHGFLAGRKEVDRTIRMGYANIACCSGLNRHTLMLSENGEVQRNTTPWIPSQLKAANVFPRTHAVYC